MISLKKLFGPVDMTTGSPWKNIAVFTVPMIIGNIAQQLYNTVDSIVVGNLSVTTHWLLWGVPVRF